RPLRGVLPYAYLFPRTCFRDRRPSHGARPEAPRAGSWSPVKPWLTPADRVGPDSAGQLFGRDVDLEVHGVLDGLPAPSPREHLVSVDRTDGLDGRDLIGREPGIGSLFADVLASLFLGGGRREPHGSF